MPIRPENADKYPADWKEIRVRILRRADNACEWCGVGNYSQRDGVKIVLTIAHIDHKLDSHDDSNLAALCQRCHNRHDTKDRARGIRERRRQNIAKHQPRLI